MSTRSKALHWWRELNDLQRCRVIRESKKYSKFAKEVSLQSNALSGRMIKELYNEFINHWKIQ